MEETEQDATTDTTLYSRSKSWKWRIPSKETINRKFQKLWGFEFDALTSYERFVTLLYRPTDPASLGVARALFGEFE